MEAVIVTGKKIRRLTVGGMLAALVAVFTAYVSVPIAGGYFHPGDAMIALSAVVLGPYAVIPAAIGSALADLLAGYTIYAPFTFVIKGLVGFVAGCGCRSGKLEARSVGMLVLAGTVIPAGYFVTDCMLYSFATALASVVWNCLQGLVCIAAGCACLGTKLGKLTGRS